MDSDLKTLESFILQEVRGVHDVVTISSKARRIKWMKRAASMPKRMLQNFSTSLLFRIPFREKTRKEPAPKRSYTRAAINYQMKSFPGNPYHTGCS